MPQTNPYLQLIVYSNQLIELNAQLLTENEELWEMNERLQTHIKAIDTALTDWEGLPEHIETLISDCETQHAKQQQLMATLPTYEHALTVYNGLRQTSETYQTQINEYESNVTSLKKELEQQKNIYKDLNAKLEQDLKKLRDALLAQANWIDNIEQK